MITQLDLRHFKCFSLLKLPLRPLTMLAGTNASGKSSVLQSLAVLHQTIRDHEWSDRLMLNGNAVRLGTVADVIDQLEGRRSLEIGVWYENDERLWRFAGDRREMSMKVDFVRIGDRELAIEMLHRLFPVDDTFDDKGNVETDNIEIASRFSRRRDGLVFIFGRHKGRLLDDIAVRDPGYVTWILDGDGDFPDVVKDVVHNAQREARNEAAISRYLARKLRDICYLTAERWGPRDQYPQEDPEMAAVVGPAGEHSASVLHSAGERDVLPSLVLGDSPPRVLQQVEARMATFFPGFQMEVEPVRASNMIRLGFRTSKAIDFHRPGHTGFGLTQVLPIVVAALSMAKDGLLLVENPGVHLHPAGQTAMGAFLAEVSAAGVQVVLETHSDHVLNGVRRTVKDGKLKSKDVAIHFFRSRTEAERDKKSQVDSLGIDDEGNIDAWPDGFFDQFDIDINYLAEWS